MFHCFCFVRYKVDFYVCVQFGESQKLRLVRILRSTVMVRVGGGWVALDEFLVKNDPCRGMYDHLVVAFNSSNIDIGH